MEYSFRTSSTGAFRVTSTGAYRITTGSTPLHVAVSAAGTLATVTWTDVGAPVDHYTQTLNAIDQGTVSSGNTMTITPGRMNNWQVFAFDASGNILAQGGISLPVSQPGLVVDHNYHPWLPF